MVSGYRETTGEAPEDSATAESILQTKLHRPSPLPDLVPRTRVLEQLKAGRVRPLTLVSAPAGYGKSILISSWLETCDDWPSAWFSLDEDDSNLRQFLRYFLAAVQSVFPQACEHTQSLVSAAQLPSLAALVTSLRNDLDAIDRPFMLMLDELNKRMAPDEIAGLHVRASEWFESHGLIEEAIQHALMAKDAGSAADIIEQHQQVELLQGRWYIVERWLAMLPVEVIQQRPRLLLAQMWGQYNTYQMLEIPPLLERVESLLVDETADETMLGEINFYRGFMLTIFQGDAESALIQFQQARKRFPRSQARNIQSEVEVVDAVAHQMAGEGALSIESLNQRIQTMGSGKGLLLSRLLLGLVYSHLLSGNLEEAIPVAQHFTRVSKKTGLINIEGSSHYLRANADLQSYHLDVALQGFQHAEKRRDIMHRKLAIDALVGLVLTHQALQRSDDAVDAMKQLMEFALNTDEHEHIIVAQSCQARLSLLQGDAKAAIAWARSFDVEAHAPSMLVWLEIPMITHLRIMVATGSHKSLQQASELLATLYQSTEAVHNTYQMIRIRILQCVALQKLGRVDESLELLQQAIKLAEPGGWVYPFVELGRPMAELLERLAEQKGVTDYARLVLDRFPTHEQQPTGSAAGESRTIAGSGARVAEPLTKREFDVLKLLAQRLQTKEIAARLFVSPETVKTHLKHLYQKLDVKNRREAAVKAAEILSRRRDTS